MATITANATHRSHIGAILYRAARAVNGVLTAFAQRRTLRELASLDDYQLADIGLRRDQLTPRLFASQRHTTR
jgi:uncharacterized protein YjiS (DUF1127 family)